MRNIAAAALACAVIPFAVEAELTVSSWDFTKDTANTTPWTAADWSDAENWSAGVPDGSGWRAELTGAEEMRYVRMNGPITLGYLFAMSYEEGSPGVTLISDYPLTMDSGGNYNVSGGRIFADIHAGAGQNEGTAYSVEINGRVKFPGLFYLASNYVTHRLDHYAVSSDPLRTDDLDVAGFYRGSGNYVAVGPRRGSAHTGEWTVTAGSAFVTRSGTTPVIAAGQSVSCGDALPDGTFVRRVYSDTVIELSQPVSATAGSGVKNLSFAAYDPVTRFTIPELRMVSVGKSVMSFVQYEEDGDFRVEVSKLTASSRTNGPVPFSPSAGYVSGTYPVRVVIHDAAPDSTGLGQNADMLLFRMGRCHIEFAETGREGARSGIPAGAATTVASGVTRLTVTNGIDAAIGLVTNFTNTIVKDGAGSLELGLTNEVTRNTGTIEVREGTLVLPAGSWVKTVAVSNGAVLRISGVFAPENFIAEEGACVIGEGVLSLPDVKSADGVVFAGGACLQVPGTGELRTAAPATNVPASVAFWVDASRIDTMTFSGNDGTNVIRIADVRGEAYGFATNTAGGFPQLVRDHRDRPHHINLPWISSANASKDPDKCMALVWDRPYTNIRAVFQVLDTCDGGGQFLGRTMRLSRNDFMRAGEQRNKYDAPIFYSASGSYNAAVRAGPFYVNGRRYNPDDGYPYPGGGAKRRLEDGTRKTWYAPCVFSAHPVGDTQADAFGFNGEAVNRSGYHRVCECLVFTNEVSETERLAITGYLMKKWLNHEVEWSATDDDPFPSVDPAQVGGIAVAEGEELSVGGVFGSETFVKRGDGALFVEDYSVADGSIDVAAGELTLNSRMPSEDDVPSGAYVHFDASDASTLTVASSGQVKAWKDVRGDGFHTADCLHTTGGWATVTHNTPLPGMTAVDFGPYKGHATESWADKHNSPVLYYPACSELHTVFMVMDTSRGGGVLVGCGQKPTTLRNPDDGYGLRRFETTGELSYASPILTNANWTGQKNLLCGNGSRVRLNGERVNPITTGFSGGWDLVSLVSYEDFGGGGFASIYNNKYVGGQAVGEAILYKEGLSDRQVEAVEAYLRWKWFGETSPRYRQAVVSNLTIRSGATLSVAGGQPLRVNGALSGGGTFKGSIAFAPGAVFSVKVDPGGVIVPLTLDGTLDFSGLDAVWVYGALEDLIPGEYRILSGASGLGDASGLKVSVDGVLRRDFRCAVRVDADGLVLCVTTPGMRMIIR